MLAKARKICTVSGHQNVEFVESRITDIPLPSASADCIISNCVVNLVPHADKQLVFSEMHRLLRPGGRVAISDILARKPLTEHIRQSMSLYVGCIAGASEVADYQRYLEVAGFSGTYIPARPSPRGDIHWLTIWCPNNCTDIVIADTESDLNVYLEAAGDGCCDSGGCCGADSNNNDISGAAQAMKEDLKQSNLNEWAGKPLPTKQTLQMEPLS